MAVLAAWEHVAHIIGSVDGPGRWAPATFAGAVIASAGFVLWSNCKNLCHQIEVMPSSAHATAVAVVLFVVGLLAYRPAMRIGLLSDDYVLLQWAREMDFLPVDWEAMRPLPLGLWWLIDSLVKAGRTPPALHLLNVTGHVLNAWLVWRLAHRLGLSGRASMAAAAFFLLWPIAVEPVVWASGVFDVLQTTLAFALCLVMTRRPDPTRADHALCVAIALLMLGTKETGVVAAPLALLVYWTRWGAGTPRGYITIGALALIATLYIGWRQWVGYVDPRLAPMFNADSIERLLLQSFGALSLPLHERVIRAHPAGAIAARLALIILVAGWTFRWRMCPTGRGLRSLLPPRLSSHLFRPSRRSGCSVIYRAVATCI